jgi:predicted HTH transcriptional regulator
MDDENVRKLISSGESEQVERKEQLKNKKPEVCQAICAFANGFPRTGSPGVVVIGQRDDGTPRGLPITGHIIGASTNAHGTTRNGPRPRGAPTGFICTIPQIARDRIAQNGNPPLEFQASAGAVAAIVRLNP